MKYLLISILILTSFIGMSQKGIGGTGWKFENSAGAKRIILFDSDLTFKYLDLVSWADVNQKGEIWGDDNETWSINEDNKFVMLFNDGYMVYSGEINESQNQISGTFMNNQGITGKFTAKRIEF